MREHQGAEGAEKGTENTVEKEQAVWRDSNAYSRLRQSGFISQLWSYDAGN